MAASQKKATPASRSRKGNGGRKSVKAPPKRPAYMPNVLARGIGTAACLFLAILLLLGMFQVEAVAIDSLCKGVKGLVGYGFWVTAPVLLLIAYLLAFRREKPVKTRIWCAALIPLVMGALLHMTLSPYSYSIAPASFSLLWRDGTHLFSGGVLGGFLGISFATWFSKIGAGLMFVIALLALLCGALTITPARVQAYLRELREEDDDDRRYRGSREAGENRREYPPEKSVRRQSQGKPIHGRRQAPDLPLDGPDPHEEPLDTEADPVDTFRKRWGGEKEPRRSFFTRKSRGKRPDEDLSPLGQEETAPPAEEGDAPLFPPVRSQPEPEPPIPPEPILADAPKPLTEKEPTPAQKRAEIRREAAQVTQSVEQSLGEEPKQYEYPPLSLLTPPGNETAQAAHEELEDTQGRLDGILNSFGIDGRVTGAVQGPSVTRYEVALEQGVRLNKLTNLADDVALALGASSVRIAPVPGKISVVGVEVPNQVVTPVHIREVLGSDAFRRHRSGVAFSVGKDIGGNYIVGDCSKLPHMLIAGTTGSGKSVCINSLIVSLLYKSTPDQVRLIMVDPKMVELGGYNGIPHLLIPVVTDPKKAAGALQWAVTEMMKRYRLFAEASVRELTAYNTWADKQENVPRMPKVVIVIDELADLMLVAAKEVEESICRVAQMGRAAGMHLVIATQRPSADVITGLMKANIPSRIAFAVASSLESRIILDTMGAEKLVGKGDMLWFPLGSGKPLRVQGCFISDEEVAAVVNCVKQNSTADYDDEVIEQIEQHMAESEKGGKSLASGDRDGDEEQDELFPSAVDVVLELGQASTSMLQRRLKLGYARAARLIDQMEQEGIVGPFEGSKPRQLLITKEQWDQMREGGGATQPEEAPGPVEDEVLSFDPTPQSDTAPSEEF